MRRLLFVTPPIGDPPLGGRAQLSDLHRRALASIFAEDFELLELPARTPPTLTRLPAMLGGRIDGATTTAEGALLGRVAEGDIGTVYFNGSNLGILARAVKRAAPHVRVSTFFHNVEARFFADAFRQSRSPRALATLLAVRSAEAAAARFSDQRLVLSNRESKALHETYGIGGTDIVPISVDDRLGSVPPSDQVVSADAPLLFVGGDFYANKAGIRWFARHVAPAIDRKTIVVGHGMDELRPELEAVRNVQVIGPAAALAPYYVEARAVVAPIFGGSGMKTKVAEALMFGKKVIGSGEAFSGYDNAVPEAGTICETADEFIAAIRALPPTAPAFDSALRKQFERHHSLRRLTDRLAHAMGRQ